MKIRKYLITVCALFLLLLTIGEMFPTSALTSITKMRYYSQVNNVLYDIIENNYNYENYGKKNENVKEILVEEFQEQVDDITVKIPIIICLYYEDGEWVALGEIAGINKEVYIYFRFRSHTDFDITLWPYENTEAFEVGNEYIGAENPFSIDEGEIQENVEEN